jgi:ubiquinone biosynthesis protein UbiJ
MNSQDRLFLPALKVFRPFVGAAINQILRTDPEIVKHLAPLEGKLLAFEITELPCFFLWVNRGEAQLLWETNNCPDGTICASLFGKVQEKDQGNNHFSHHNLTYQVLGDPETARAVRIFLSEFEPDWEERLAGLMGDTMAHKAGQSVRAAAGWTRNARRSAMKNFSEYLQEERQALAARSRVERHLNEVARLQHGVDALEKRLASLLGCLAE